MKKNLSDTAVRMLVSIPMIAMGIGAFWLQWSDGEKSERCSAAVEARLDNQYTEIQKKRNGVVVSSEFEVSYTFDIDGQQYRGKETLPTEPTEVETTVFYNPENPSENELVQNERLGLYSLMGVGFIGVAIFLLAEPAITRRRESRARRRRIGQIREQAGFGTI